MRDYVLSHTCGLTCKYCVTLLRVVTVIAADVSEAVLSFRTPRAVNLPDGVTSQSVQSVT